MSIREAFLVMFFLLVAVVAWIGTRAILDRDLGANHQRLSGGGTASMPLATKALRGGASAWKAWFDQNYKEAELNVLDFRSLNFDNLDLSGVEIFPSFGRNLEASKKYRDFVVQYSLRVPVSLDAGERYLPQIDPLGVKMVAFDGASFVRTNLSGALIIGPDFSRANMIGADLSRAALYEASFRGTNLSQARGEGALFLCADFQGADLKGADFSSSKFLYADFGDSSLSSARFPNAHFFRADLGGADFRFSDLSGALIFEVRGWKQAQYQGANVKGCRWEPEEAREFALQQGAVEMTAERWAEFVQSRGDD